MLRTLVPAVFLAMIGSSVLPSVAIAEDSYACAVVKNINSQPVALREAQSTESKLLLRLNSYEIILVALGEKSTGSAWTEVISVPRVDGYWDNPLRLKSTRGWARSSMLAVSKCPQQPLQIIRTDPLPSNLNVDAHTAEPTGTKKEDMHSGALPEAKKEDLQQ